jgi:hypothetical protein
MCAALTSMSMPRLARRAPEEVGQRGRQPEVHAAGPHEQRQARGRQLQQRHAVGRHWPEVRPPLLRAVGRCSRTRCSLPKSTLVRLLPAP